MSVQLEVIVNLKAIKCTAPYWNRLKKSGSLAWEKVSRFDLPKVILCLLSGKMKMEY